ncbi:MAG: class I SAM-dependent RNA methyltransferase [Spartobacteria bacterium]|nr:class I SAM-dependent RNA methyltransferase [Spartobacteria bacterium]
MTIQLSDIIDVDIQDVAYRGKGVARHEGCVLFVPGVLKGETVRVRVTGQKKNFYETELLRVLKPAEARIAPVCPHAYVAEQTDETICPGCCYQHMDYETEVATKQDQFTGQLKRFAQLDDGCFLPPTASSFRMGYRNKITLHSDTKKLGYFTQDNTTLLDIERCPLALPGINRLLESIRADELFPETLAAHEQLTIRSTEPNGCFSWWDKADPETDWISESTSLGKFRFHPSSFFQVNPNVAEKLLVAVSEIFRQLDVKQAIDLYCGVGVFSIAARLAGIHKVTGIDVDKRAIKAARVNAMERNLNGLKFIAGKTAPTLKERFPRVKGRETLLVVDPPRKGLDKETRQWILAKHPCNLLYVSCAVDTLARDVAALAKAGYQCKQAQLFDMFPRTPYFESLVWLHL